MAKRKVEDWLTAYCDYASYGEAPRHMTFWCGVSAVAGALRRKVYLDMAYFRWTPNFYIVVVAPPGIVSKSTTVGIAIRLLRQVPNIRFGPEVITWQALVQCLAASAEAYEYKGDYLTMSPLTLESSELGNLLNPHDREMVDLLVTLWDGKDTFSKITKMSGNDEVANPWVNLIACTTPSWLAGNFPEYLVGGGFTSRCIFVYVDKKERYVAYPSLQVPKDLRDREQALIEDLTTLAQLVGPYRLTDSATTWGTDWYQAHYENRPAGLDDDRFGGYIARKQTHIHKLAMVLSASRSDVLVVEKEDLVMANKMVTDLEADMPSVFAKIGKSEPSAIADRFINFVKRRGVIPYGEGLKWFYAYYPDNKDLEGMLSGVFRSGHLIMESIAGNLLIKPAYNTPLNHVTETPQANPV